jgi:hypothetical protein
MAAGRINNKSSMRTSTNKSAGIEYKAQKNEKEITF